MNVNNIMIHLINGMIDAGVPIGQTKVYYKEDGNRLKVAVVFGDEAFFPDDYITGTDDTVWTVTDIDADEERIIFYLEAQIEE